MITRLGLLHGGKISHPSLPPLFHQFDLLSRRRRLSLKRLPRRPASRARAPESQRHRPRGIPSITSVPVPTRGLHASRQAAIRPPAFPKPANFGLSLHSSFHLFRRLDLCSPLVVVLKPSLSPDSTTPPTRAQH